MGIALDTLEIGRRASSPDAQPRVLLVDDDLGIRRELSAFLANYDFHVTAMGDASSLEQALAGEAFDILILDVMLPGESGLEICKRLSATRRIPIVMISAMGTDTDRIIGLELGADSYLAKPFNPRELVALLRAHLRRRTEGVALGGPPREYQFAGWRMNMMRYQIFTPSGISIQLSSREFRTLTAFVEHPLRVLSRDQILEFSCRGDEEPYDRVVDVMVSRLRAKLAIGCGGEALIQTVRREGYMFNEPVARL